MNAVRESCRPKHQVLILKCFPRYQKGVLEVKPNSSELSYLLYYVSTRRSKLQKVGAFLEKKAARDVSKGRVGNVQVVLQILTALVEKLPRELPLYAHSVLTVIETVIGSKDVTMVEETVPTFEMFCSSQDLSVLAVEQQYATQYLNIVRSYAQFALSKTKTPLDTTANLPMTLRLKNIGLRAIKSMVGSESLSGDGGKQLAIIVPVILENLYTDDEDTLEALHLKTQTLDKAENEMPKHHRRTSTATVPTTDAPAGDAAEASGTTADADKAAELEVRLLALKCLERIFVVSSNRSQIRTAAGLVLEFVVDHHENSEKIVQDSSAWAQSLMELIAKWCPVQDRFIVLFTAVEILRGMSADDHPIQQQIIMASLIDSLLKSPVNMIGLSVIDVLVGFVQHILRLLQAPTPQASEGQQPLATKEGDNANDATVNGDLEKTSTKFPQSHNLTPENERLASLLKQCIGDLATHIYYADQIFDMIRTLLKRIRPPVLSDATASNGAVNTVLEPSASTNQIPNTANERQSENFFYSANARITALEAVKSILVVASNKTATSTGAGIVSRNPVGIQVWEGTQWLLKDSDRQVQTAYANALLYWLQLETSKCDLQVKDATKKVFRSQSKKEPGSGRKAPASSAATTDKKPASVSSNFLQLLHLTLYDIAVEFASVDPQIFVVYLLLVSLVEHLGVNAVRFGLPMVLKLQEVVPPSESLSSADAQVNIGSLVYGYLSALTEKFDFETSKVGAGIHSEIMKRKKRGAWLEYIQFPPLPLSQIPLSGNKVSRSDIDEPFHVFSAPEDIVRQVENAYTASLIAAPQSPPSSPGRTVPPQVPGQAFSNPNQDLKLPAEIKEDMLSPWSREASLAILEKEKTRAASLAGSKHASSAKRNYGSLNGFGNNSPRDSPTATERQDTDAFGTSVSGFQVPRSASLPDRSLAESNRDSTIRVNDLKRMLTVGGSSNVRRSSPLRGRLDAVNGSIASSSSESLISGTFSTSDIGTESRPQSIRGEGSETPKAAPATSPSSGKSNSNENSFTDLGDDIPPVPPLPSGLAIPGGFPDTSSNLSRQSSTRSDHPSPSPTTVNFARNGSLLNNKSSAQQLGRSLSGKKSRSNNSLNNTSRKTTPTAVASPPATPNNNTTTNNNTQSPNSRLEIDKLLDGVLPQESSLQFDPIQLTLETPGLTKGKSRTLEERRKITSGIGRPPY